MLTEHGTCCVFDAWWTLMQGRYQRWYNFWISISLVVCCIPGCFLVLCPVILLGIPETVCAYVCAYVCVDMCVC